ncbi:hypothetical protein HDE_13085 [Halotydeus destructor]|nr:hypothetical protein HDE_13085 [Halotydeus destructor]
MATATKEDVQYYTRKRMNAALKRGSLESASHWPGSEESEDTDMVSDMDKLDLNGQNEDDDTFYEDDEVEIGLLCPYCREGCLEQQADEESKWLVCDHCCFRYRSRKSMAELQRIISDILTQHRSTCTKGKEPNYGLFKTSIVVECDACGMVKNIN